MDCLMYRVSIGTKRIGIEGRNHYSTLLSLPSTHSLQTPTAYVGAFIYCLGYVWVQ